jgi:hypothetical protein
VQGSGKKTHQITGTASIERGCSGLEKKREQMEREKKGRYHGIIFMELF